MITNFKIFEGFRKDKYDANRKRLAEAIVAFMIDLFPKTKCKMKSSVMISTKRVTYEVLIHTGTALIDLSPKYDHIDDLLEPEKTLIFIYPEHSIYDFLYYVFDLYVKSNYNIIISDDDIDNIISKFTVDNYERYLMEEKAKKYNL